MGRSRRSILATAGSLAALSGCIGQLSTSDDNGLRPYESDAADPDLGNGGDDGSSGGPPIRSEPRYVGHELEEIRDGIIGVLTEDSIPAVDEPNFTAAENATLDPGHPVFGAVRNGEAKAYPQRILVWHEIVNDQLGGDPVAVTYCPLTGTAQGFERGAVEFGVSGRLVNSNLIMYDRDLETWWSQIMATGIDGPQIGSSLDEFRVIWTTWERWQDRYPDTLLLTEDTGWARRYGTDPYGSYNPPSGYYADEDLMYQVLAEDDRLHPKDVVIGARTESAAIAFEKDSLLEARVLTGQLEEDTAIAVADPELQTGYIYRDSDGQDLTRDGDGYRIDGSDEVYAPSELPLERIVCFDAMWFAWYACYPSTNYVD